MSLRQLIAVVFAATALLWGGWAWTLWTIDPEATNGIGFILFYLIFFMAVVGTLSILGISIRHKREPDALVYHIVSVAFRQAFLLSVFALFLLILQGQRWVHWYVIIIGFVTIVGVEAFSSMREIRARRSRPTSRYSTHLPTQNRGVASVSIPDQVQPTFTKRVI